MTSREPDEDKGTKFGTPMLRLYEAETLASLPVFHVIVIPNWNHSLKDILEGIVYSDRYIKKGSWLF